MRAAVMYGRGDIRIEDVPVPEPDAGELLVEVHAAGVCGTDAAEYLHGPSMFPIEAQHRVTGHSGPMIPGHEFGGRIVAVGDDVPGFAEGDLVASGAGVSCGACFQCVTGRTNLCVDYWTVGLQRHGALAQYVAVPAATCLNVSAMSLKDDAVALVQPMSIAAHAMRRGRPDPTEPVVVIGVGGIGAFLTYALAESGIRVVAADLVPARLDVAHALGAAATIAAGADQPLAQMLAKETPHPRVVYEATGTAAGLDAAVEVVAPGGRVVAIGLQKAPRRLDLLLLSLLEKEIIGTNAHAFAADFAEAARLVESRSTGWSDVAPLVLPLDQLDAAIRDMHDGGVSPIKTLLDPWADAPRSSRT